MTFWRSQNISSSPNAFELRKKHPLIWGNENDDVNIDRYAQYLFDTARVPYVAFGPQHTPRALVFQVIRTGQSTLLSLIPAISHFPRTERERMGLFRFVFQQLVDVEGLGPKRHMRVRLMQRPHLVRDIVVEFLKTALIFRWDIVAVDGHRKREAVDHVLNLLEENKMTIDNNLVVSRSDSMLPHDTARTHDDDTLYWIAKRKLENFLLKNNIQERQTFGDLENTQRDIEYLLPLYTTWFDAMLRLYSDRMPETLQQVLNTRVQIQNARNVLEENTMIWGRFFMRFDTKYPLLVAAIYLWRISHWLRLRGII